MRPSEVIGGADEPSFAGSAAPAPHGHCDNGGPKAETHRYLHSPGSLLRRVSGISPAMTILSAATRATETAVAGIDVGAPRKGFHAVILRGAHVVAKFHSREPSAMAQWCSKQGAMVVAVDAPCRWRVPGSPARAAERELAANRISCFSTPTEAKARGHAFYTWMLAGEKLYHALAPHYPLYAGDDQRSGVAMETFPQAVACALAGERVSAKGKLAIRTALIVRAGVDASALDHIDEVDAALCALAGQHFVMNQYKAYGDATGGYIIVPSPARE